MHPPWQVAPRSFTYNDVMPILTYLTLSHMLLPKVPLVFTITQLLSAVPLLYTMLLLWATVYQTANRSVDYKYNMMLLLCAKSRTAVYPAISDLTRNQTLALVVGSSSTSSTKWGTYEDSKWTGHSHAKVHGFSLKRSSLCIRTVYYVSSTPLVLDLIQLPE